MDKSKILLVTIRGSYNAAKKAIKKGNTDINYRKTLRDMTVQYWCVPNLAPEIGIICGVKGNVIYSAFEVNDLHPFDTEIRGGRNKVAFNCDKIREDLIGIRLPEVLAFSGGSMLCSSYIEEFYDLISSQYEKGEVLVNRQKVYDEIKADGIPMDNKDGVRQNYQFGINYARREYCNERDQQIRKKALERAKSKCELYECDKCSFCETLSKEQRSRLEVHHIDELHDDPNINDNLENLIVVCHSLHRRYHYHMSKKEQKNTKQRFINIRHAKPY